MIRSRLRRPTSKSTMTVRWPACASPAPSAALVVVFPTPPFPEVTTTIFATLRFPRVRPAEMDGRVMFSSETLDLQLVAAQRHLHGCAGQRLVELLADAVDTRDRHELGAKALAEDPRRRVAVHARERTPVERAVDVHVTVR